VRELDGMFGEGRVGKATYRQRGGDVDGAEVIGGELGIGERRRDEVMTW